MKRRTLLLVSAVLAAGLIPLSQGFAQPKEVVIGVLYPLSGPVAQVGIDAVAAVKTAVEIVNEDVDLNVPLGPGKGLPNLGGAKIRIVVADHQGKPDVGQSDAERMITQEKVNALYGAYYSSVTAAGSQVAERFQIPWVNGESTSPKLTKRGFKWFFRTTPHDAEFTQLMFDFIRDFQAEKGMKLSSVAIFHEDTLWGTDSGRVQNDLAKGLGYKVVSKISYRAKTTSLTPEVQRIKAASPDVFLPSSYTSDAMLFLRTAKELDYNPKLLVAQNAGYTDPTFLKTMGKDAEGVITRSPFNMDLARTIPLINKINTRFKKHSGGRDLSDVPVRAFTGFMALVDAINRAGSTDPNKIREALTKTNIPSDKLIVPWKGIKFGPDGQNLLVRGILMQVQNGKYCTIYPFDLAACKLVYPMPTWKQKAKM
ncbi:MAG: ABC transporter substrate-binding protein [Nitrospira sp.]|nr:ABC transporter substrate-binding protein [Nitrospira sp.]